MYNNNVLPQTGMMTVGLGLTANNCLAIGLTLIVVGLISFKLLKFKTKDR
jgi:hypothetical protein